MKVNEGIERALTRAGGKTLTGIPKYKFMWSGDFTYLISNGSGYEPFRVVSEDCWLLLKFEEADFWGTEEEWGIENREPSGLFTAGPFPHQGRYRNIMRIKRRMRHTDGQIYYEHCAPTIQWVREFFPGVRDFLELPVDQKAKYLEDKEQAEKDALNLSFMKSRELYKGAATAKQIKAKEEAIERWLHNEAAVAEAQKLIQNRKMVN